MTAPALDRRFPCHQCGAALVFSPGTTALACPYCEAQNEIDPAAAPVEELDFAAYAERALAAQADAAATADQIVTHCDTCGADVQFPENVTSHTCPFCSSPVVATGRSVKHIKPNAVLPFRLQQAEAKQAYERWLGGLWFAPSDIKKSTRLEARLAGVYLPYWTFDADVTTRYAGQRGDYYYVTVGSGENRRRERRTRWRPARGTVQNRFDDVLVPAALSLPHDQLVKLEPWDLKDAVPYDDAFLAGFRAESYGVDLVQGFAVARTLMLPVIRQTVRRDIGGDEQRIDAMQHREDDVTFKHLLLPVWISSYRYRTKLFQILINARTGEVIGKRPYSAPKIILAVLVGLAILAAIGLFVAHSRGG